MGRHVATCDCVKCFNTRMKNGKLRFSDVILAAKKEGLSISVELKEVCGE